MGQILSLQLVTQIGQLNFWKAVDEGRQPVHLLPSGFSLVLNKGTCVCVHFDTSLETLLGNM